MSKLIIAETFSKAADTYHEACELQLHAGKQLLTLARTFVKKEFSIVDVGCGTGKITQLFAEHLPFKNFDALDFSAPCIEKAKHLTHLPVTWRVADYDQMKKKSYYDLMLSNMALHWSPDLVSTFRSLYSSLKTKGRLIFSIPVTESLQEIAAIVSTHDFKTVDDVLAQLKNAGLTPTHWHVEKASFLYETGHAGLQSFKKVGANYVSSRIKTFNKALRSFLKTKNVSITYQILYCVAEK